MGRTNHYPVVTNDYNMNRVAELQGVRVLNINELANSVKPAVLPGEEMRVRVIQEGKEFNQGVAYLDDGTMISWSRTGGVTSKRRCRRGGDARAANGGRADDLRHGAEHRGESA